MSTLGQRSEESPRAQGRVGLRERQYLRDQTGEWRDNCGEPCDWLCRPDRFARVAHHCIERIERLHHGIGFLKRSVGIVHTVNAKITTAGDHIHRNPLWPTCPFLDPPLGPARPVVWASLFPSSWYSRTVHKPGPSRASRLA